MSRVILAVVLLAILAMGGAVAFQAALETGGEAEAVVNESWQPTAGDVTALNESERADAFYEEAVVVRDENETVVDEGSDYEWLAGNGTVKAVAGGDLDGDSVAYIDYNYTVTTQEQRDNAAVLSQVPRVIGIALPAVAALILFGRFIQ